MITEKTRTNLPLQSRGINETKTKIGFIGRGTYPLRLILMRLFHFLLSIYICDLGFSVNHNHRHVYARKATDPAVRFSERVNVPTLREARSSKPPLLSTGAQLAPSPRLVSKIWHPQHKSEVGQNATLFPWLSTLELCLSHHCCRSP